MLRWWPKPTMLEPHITGFSFVATCMMSEMVLQSLRTPASLIAAKNSLADFSVFLVLGSATVSSSLSRPNAPLLYGREPLKAVDARSKGNGRFQLVGIQIQDFNYAGGRATNVCVVALGCECDLAEGLRNIESAHDLIELKIQHKQLSCRRDGDKSISGQSEL